MKIQLVSDLHWEFHADKGRSFVDSMDASEIDVLIVAGDLATCANLEAALSWLCQKYAKVVFVSGNHEYYHASPQKVGVVRRRLMERWANLHWLEEEVVEIQSQRFVGTSLWFSDSERVRKYKSRINDFSLIKDFVPWVFETNRQAIEFLNREVREGDVVVTHHLPHPVCVAPRFKNDPLNVYFLCDVAELVENRGAKLWCFGHTHDPVDRIGGKTRLLCNPFGYPYEGSQSYQDRLIVEV